MLSEVADEGGAVDITVLPLGSVVPEDLLAHDSSTALDKVKLKPL